jgi:hypothetical protein
MKEIGGYFGFEELISNEYYKILTPLNTGRNALLYILRARNIKKLYLPYYLGNSISNMCKKYGYEVEFYQITSEFLPILNKKLLSDEYLYIVNYYGQLTDEIIIKLKKQYAQIILDNTQAFFHKPLLGIDTIYTCRKFFGTPDGAYLATDRKLEEELFIDVSNSRMNHILGRYEGKASDYYNAFKENEESFAMESLKKMSKLTHNILGAIDYKKVYEIRESNYNYLEKELGIHNNLKLVTPQGPFAYPLYVENGIWVRTILAKNNIYVPMLWSNVTAEMSNESIEYQYAANILPLPCDQRYGVTDMNIIIRNLKTILMYDRSKED